MEDDNKKLKILNTSKSLKETVENAGLLCLNLYPNDYIALGASIFIGLRRTKGSQAAIAICTPNGVSTRLYQYEVGDDLG